jgi:hypothetical protein
MRTISAEIFVGGFNLTTGGVAIKGAMGVVENCGSQFQLDSQLVLNRNVASIDVPANCTEAVLTISSILVEFEGFSGQVLLPSGVERLVHPTIGVWKFDSSDRSLRRLGSAVSVSKSLVRGKSTLSSEIQIIQGESCSAVEVSFPSSNQAAIVASGTFPLNAVSGASSSGEFLGVTISQSGNHAKWTIDLSSYAVGEHKRSFVLEWQSEGSSQRCEIAALFNISNEVVPGSAVSGCQTAPLSHWGPAICANGPMVSGRAMNYCEIATSLNRLDGVSLPELCAANECLMVSPVIVVDSTSAIMAAECISSGQLSVLSLTEVSSALPTAELVNIARQVINSNRSASQPPSPSGQVPSVREYVRQLIGNALKQVLAGEELNQLWAAAAVTIGALNLAEADNDGNVRFVDPKGNEAFTVPTGTIASKLDVVVDSVATYAGLSASADVPAPTPSGAVEVPEFHSNLFVGCMDPMANNFNPLARSDDGSCFYSYQFESLPAGQGALTGSTYSSGSSSQTPEGETEDSSANNFSSQTSTTEPPVNGTCEITCFGWPTGATCQATRNNCVPGYVPVGGCNPIVEESCIAPTCACEPMGGQYDSDHDGYPNIIDECPNAPGSVNGCDDADGDTFAGPYDWCPETAGTIHGCIDTDGDELPDIYDECKTVPGTENGCPVASPSSTTLPTYYP